MTSLRAPEREASTVWRPAVPVDVRLTLGPLRHGSGDPTSRVLDRAVWRTTRLASGPATLRVGQGGPREVHATAWGPGAEEAVAGLPDLLGGDVPYALVPRHPLLVDAWARHPGLRIPRSGRVVEALVPAVLEQKVTGKEALRAFRVLCLGFGTPAPGPLSGLVLPPTAEQWRRIPSWEWHRAGVDPKRSRTIVHAMAYAARLEEAAALPHAAASERMRALPGIGVWTAAEVAQRALGDLDAVSVGDYHLAGHVGWALLGRPVDDAGMLEVLAEWAGFRQLVCRLIQVGGVRKPRFGPRLTVQDHRWH